jgi:ankyrin repeat protein
MACRSANALQWRLSFLSLKATMRILFIAALLACTFPALAMTDAERNLISTSAKKDPTGWNNQETVNAVQRLGSAGDLEALDFIISLNHWPLAGVYVSRYRESQVGKDSAPFEQRLLAQYDNPRMATTLMRGLDKYASSAVLDRLLGDATRLAKAYADEAKHCKIFAKAQEHAPNSRLGATDAPMRRPVFGLMAATDSIRKTPQLDCAGAAPQVDHERFRMQEAVRMFGKTDRTDAALRIQPLLADLTAAPLPRDEEAAAMASAWTAAHVTEIHSIAGLIGRQRYRDAGADLAAIVRKLPPPARTEKNLVAAWPLMQALARLDRREGTEAIAEWVEWRSANEIGAVMTPTTADMVRLLSSVLPEAQIDVAALRRRVLPGVPDARRVDYEKAFDAADRANQDLRHPKEETLITSALKNDPRLVRYVLSAGITPNAHDSTGDTALTAISGHEQRAYLEVITILLDAGADPDGPGAGGMTPFHKAVEGFSPRSIEPYKMVNFWYAKKADLNRAAAFQGTPLTTAAERSTDMVKYLLERGAKTEIASREGLTPLHFAVRSKNVESSELLLKAGADVNAKIYGGITPLLVAQDNNDPAMEALLERHGGRVDLAFKAKRAVMIRLYPGSH